MSITIYMTINARRDDDDVCQKHNDDKTMGTVWPALRIQRCQHYIVGHMGVGDEGRQGGASGGRVGGALRTLLIVELGSRSFFRRRDVRACTHNIFVKKYGTTTV